MRHTTVTCQSCNKTIVPRTQYRYGRAISNHCPFCLSENWDGMMPSWAERLFNLLGVALGVVASILSGAILFETLLWSGVLGLYTWLIFPAIGLAVFAGYRFYSWFIDWDCKAKRLRKESSPNQAAKGRRTRFRDFPGGYP